jgi:hypothetical protein
MTRKFVGFVLLLTLSLPGNAVAGPPEPTKGAMNLDKIADGLRQYQQSKAENKRVEWLKRLAPSRDPRVKAALETALSDASQAVATAASELIAQHYGRPAADNLPVRRIRFHKLPQPNGPPES